MIDISQIFKSGKAEQPAASPVQVLAIAVEKREDMGPVREALKKAEFKVDAEVEREDGTVMYPQVDEFEEGEATIYKASDEVIALLSGTMVKKSAEAGFVKDLFGEAGYLPSMQEACIAVCKSILTEAGNATAENFEQFQLLMKQDFEALADYISDTLTSIPEGLLALDLPEAVAKQEEPAAEEPAPVVAKKEDSAEGSPQGEADNKGAPQAQGLEPVLEQLGDLATVVKSISEAVSAQGDELKALKDGQEALSGKVSEVEEVAKAANDAMGGTIVGGEPAGDRAPASRIPVEKAEDDPYAGNFDTAFLPGAKH